MTASGTSARPRSYAVTPDGHYFVVRGRLWRCTNPNLDPSEKERLVSELMQARRAVRQAKDDPHALRLARQQVQQTKVALGERGPPWWGADAPTYDRKMVKNTPYGAWYMTLRQPS